MRFVIQKNRMVILLSLLFLCLIVIFSLNYTNRSSVNDDTSIDVSGEKNFIKWVDFNVPYEVLDQALTYDLETAEQDIHLNWIELLACTAAKTGGQFSSKRSKTLDQIAERLLGGESLSDITASLEYYPYFKEAYSAALGGIVGPYHQVVENPDEPDNPIIEDKYGLRAYSPIAKGYAFSHYDDFGASRSYGYQRLHLGNDLMGSVGTPIIAVESGIVEALGWNQYGGWRVGIRSFDGKRYYYYAHLRRNHPYHNQLSLGSFVTAGDVIGYLGMTGYSVKENVNNIDTPHLHFGLQLIFDESQKEGTSEIWIDVYNIIKLLQKNRSPVIKDEETKDYYRTEQTY